MNLIFTYKDWLLMWAVMIPIVAASYWLYVRYLHAILAKTFGWNALGEDVIIPVYSWIGMFAIAALFGLMVFGGHAAGF